MKSAFDLASFDVQEYDRILSHGLSQGMGQRGQKVCIEAAICQVLGLPHGDDPGCVASSVRRFKITLNDSPKWSSPISRANGLHDLGLAQLGSKNVVDDNDFCKLISEKTIGILIPKLFREAFPENQNCLDAAKECETKRTYESAKRARTAATTAAAYAADAADAAAYAADASTYAADAADYAADASTYAADAAAYAADEKYLKLSADLAIDVLRELNSPGVTLLDRSGCALRRAPED